MDEDEVYEAMRREAEEIDSLLREGFLTGIRKSLFKSISRVKGGATQWRYIIGKLSRYKNGTRITLSEHSLKELQRVLDYLNTSEGFEALIEVGITEAPDHVDGLIDWIQSAKKDREMKADEFRMFLKHKESILKHLQRINH